ncbi:lanthionine synthetase C family protein [Streptomyces violarus]|uniref:lanthionine synthetase C family protein n=1 Tax=Streptomyces violarus TaxID=67380 RepID=UPI0021C0DD66|nr:lanthionine synthetase C family protein [Streptomyces violarus]MCT9139773.1 lanthionine synthetase C family protein [Streptomyces violarus]
MEQRESAAEIVHHIIESLRSWEKAQNGTGVSGPFVPGTIDEREWESLSLTNGFPGVALLFAEHSANDPASSKIAHEYLDQARLHVRAADLSHPGLYHGIGSLAFAVNAAHQATGGYRSSIETLDTAMRRGAATILENVHSGISATFRNFDAISGLSGVGRYLLNRPTSDNRDALKSILSYCVSLTEMTEEDGEALPRWWVRHAPNRYIPDAQARDGHGNLGLAHGIAGPLTLLIDAHVAGVEVDGQLDSIRALADTLLRWTAHDEYGMYWPSFISFTAFKDGALPAGERRLRPSWCYGVPGVSYAVLRAGTVLRDARYRTAAIDSVNSMLSLPPDALGIADSSICHGWAGLLHLVQKIERTGEVNFSGAADLLAARVIEQFNPETPFGYQFAVMDPAVSVNSPGFLDGAAGVALALHSYAHDENPVSQWDSALLLA